MSTTKRAALAAALVLFASCANAQDISDAGLVVWGGKLERLEYRFGGGNERVAAYEGDAFAGTDEIKLRWEGEGEYDLDENEIEEFENQFVLQTPVSTFFDAKAGIRFDNPDGPDRIFGTIGLHGLAPQWFEIDADAFFSQEGDISGRIEAEYEGLITQNILLVPSVEVDFGLSRDREVGLGAGLRSAEIGARLSYDLSERNIQPYIGVHYEHLFGATRGLARREGDDTEGVFAVAGIRLSF